MSARFVVGAAIALVVVFVAALAVFVLTPDSSPEIEGRLRRTDAAFEQGAIQEGPHDAAYSRDGALVAAISGQGVGLVRNGRHEVLVRSRPGAASRVVDFAWMPGSKSLMLVEGPFNASKLSVIDLEGEVIAAVALEPTFSAGDGHGLAVDYSNRRAVVTSVTRDAIGGRRRLDLVSVNLQSGAVTPLTETAEVDESTPFFLDNDTLLFTRQAGEVAEAMVMDLATGRAERVSPEGRRALAVGTLAEGEYAIYQELGASGGSVAAVPAGGGAPRSMGTIEGGTTVVAVHPDGGQAIVRPSLAGTATGTRLQTQPLDPPPPPSGLGLGSVPPRAREPEVPLASSPLRRKSWRSTSS